MTSTTTPSAPDNLASVRQLLPASAQAMAALIGDELTLRLIAVRGGCSLSVPQFADKGPGRKAAARLAGEVGEELAARLLYFYAGERLYVPRCAAALDALRAVEIHRAATAAQQMGRSLSATVAELASAHGLADRTVEEILKRPAPVLEGGQP